VIGDVARPAHAPRSDRVGRGPWPNPFRGSTTFPKGTGDAIDLFDVEGRRVRRMSAGGSVEPRWDGADDRGRPLPPGLYLARSGRGECVRVVKLE
jgi:hypothetical protein